MELLACGCYIEGDKRTYCRPCAGLQSIRKDVMWLECLYQSFSLKDSKFKDKAKEVREWQKKEKGE